MTQHYRICLLPGDGIGPEVTQAAAQVLKALPLSIEFVTAEIGYGAYQKLGTPLPDGTLEKILSCDASFFGAVTTPPNIAGYFSPVVRMRRTLDLYANIRPCKSLPNPLSRPGIDLVVVRENTEDLYAGIERVEDGGNKAVGEMVITRRASERIVRAACELARKRGFRRVTVVHKANVLRETCGLFRKAAFEVAQSYPDLAVDEMLVDSCAMELVRDPAQFQVIVTTNLFGDILSDEASMLVGGLGVAASGNLGEKTAVFEPVHGSAPKLAGQNKANPVASFLTMSMLLDYLGEAEQSRQVESAVLQAIAAGEVTADLGGNLFTTQVTKQVISRLK